MFRRYWLLLVFFGIITGCMVGPTHKSLKNARLPELIPAKTFSQNEGYWHYEISPDGTRVAFNSQKKNRPIIGVMHIGSDNEYIIKSLYPSHISNYEWLPDSRRIVFSQTVKKNTRHIFLVDTDNPDQPPIDLTPGEKGKIEIAHIGQAETDKIWITDYSKEKRVDLQKLDLTTKALDLVETTDTEAEIDQWIMDSADRLRARIIRNEDLSQRLELYHPEDKTWKIIIEWDVDEDVHFLDFSSDDRFMWVLSNRNRERASLVILDLETGKEKLFYEDPQADVLRVSMSKNRHAPLIAYSFPDFPKVHFLDPEMEKLLRPLLPDPPTGFLMTGADDNEEIIGYTLYSDKTKDNYIYDSHKNQKHIFADNPISLYASELADMRPINYSGRDGMVLKGFLTLPNGVAPKNLPTVLLVHGGPWGRDDWEYDNLVQFLANRGYAVLQVNYRGSTGFGKTYMRRAIGEFAGAMHDDLVDGLQWAVDQGYTDPDHVAIMGWSYGGYASLVGLTFTPELFKCAIAIAGMSDLTTLVEADYRNLSPTGKHYWHKYAGDPEKDQDHELMKAKSPITHVDKITRPLLIVHGGEDTVVSSDESDRMVEAMQKAGKQVEYIFFPDEGHSFQKWENWSVLYKKIEVFLAAHLGGRR